MFKIGMVYHVVHVVSDLDAADAWYDEVFAPNRYYRGYNAEAMRDASLLAIGDFVMEVVAPAKVPGVENSALGRFSARFGQRLHSVAWFVDSVPEVFKALSRHNVRMYSLGGDRLEEPRPGRAVWTHPKDTHGMLEFSPYGGLSPHLDPRLKPGWSTAFWRDEHPLGIERVSHFTAVVRDLAKAKPFYEEALGGNLLQEEEIAGRKRSSYFALGDVSVMEAAEPLSSSGPEGRELERAGEALYAVTFKVKDIRKAADFLRSKNVRFESEDAETIVLDREDAMGAVLGFTQRRLPNDLRE